MKAAYKTTRPTYTNGATVTPEANQRGDLTIQEQFIPDYEDNANDVAHTHARAIPTSTGAWSNTNSGGTPVGNTIPAVIKASAGRVRRLTITNKSATVYVIMLKNKASAMVATDPPDERFVAPVTSTFTVDFGPSGRYFSTGIALAVSTTAGYDTLTVPGAGVNDIHYSIDWI